LNLECWVAPRSHAVSQAGEAFDAQGHLVRAQNQQGMEALVQQVLWAAGRAEQSPTDTDYLLSAAYAYDMQPV
jgi:hypothetical protein